MKEPKPIPAEALKEIFPEADTSRRSEYYDKVNNRNKPAESATGVGEEFKSRYGHL